MHKNPSVPKSHVNCQIDERLRDLCHADYVPIVNSFDDGKVQLTVTRDGEIHALPISRRVAEELIATGHFGWGN